MTPQHMLTWKLVRELHSNKNKIQKRIKFEEKISNYIFQYQTKPKKEKENKTTLATVHWNFKYDDINI